MEKKPVKIDTVYQCNCFLGEKTLHPLTSVIDLSKTNGKLENQLKFGFYTILLQECNCECFIYGRQHYDFSDGTLLFLSPDESLNLQGNQKRLCSKGHLLAFHPDLIRYTSLGQHFRNYTFFSYTQEESLHLSLREKQIVLNCLENLNQELQRSIDRHSQTIVSRYIELLLDYCTRFYDRQFITRSEANQNLLEKADRLLNDYFLSGRVPVEGLPTTQYCSIHLGLSSYYWEDLLKHETGKTMHDYIQFKRMELAKKQIRESRKSISLIADELGFPSVSHFSLLFKKLTGYTPNVYKLLN